MNEAPKIEKRWRRMRRVLIGLAVLATLIALFYTEEDWRGKRAWERYKSELEAKGDVLNWSAYIPPPVPDDQNFFKAPGITESNWVGRGSRELSRRLSAAWQDKSNSIAIANLTVVLPDNAPKSNANETILRLNDPDMRAEAEQLIRRVLGPSLPSAHERRPLVTKPINQITPEKLILVSDTIPTDEEILAVFPETVDGSHVQVKESGGDSFQVLLNPAPIYAGDFVRLTDAFEADFDVVREALKRPYARMDGDYSVPAFIPIPNFVTLRIVAQLLAERTRSSLLLAQPARALPDLTLLRDICRVTEAKPTGKPMTLVASMIHVAIIGLYVDTIADGLRLQAWQEPQLIAIQQQLAGVNLAPFVNESFHEERVSAVQAMGDLSRSELARWFVNEKASFPKRLMDSRYWFIMLAPRGWFYQNMVLHTKIMQPILQAYDSTNNLILPGKTTVAQQGVNKVRMSPHSFLNLDFLPNFVRAWLLVAYNQTMANEAQIACALERYRLAHGNYPETLDTLVPKFIEKLPHDIIGGDPLHYRRKASGKYLLYSVGWNETDDGGVAAPMKGGGRLRDMEDEDWVWRN